MALGRRIAYNVVVNVVAKIASTALSLVSIGILTRYLGTEGFGAYATVLAFFALFTAVADLGLYQITARDIGKQDAATEQRTIERVLALRAIVSTIVATLGIIASFALPYDAATQRAIIIIAIAFLFSSSYGLLNSVFQKHLRMDLVVVTEFFGKVVQTATIAIVATLDAGLTWAVSSVLFAMIFNFIGVSILVHRFVRLRMVWDLPYWRTFLQQSLPVGISAIITFLYFKIDTILLSIMQTTYVVGVYNAAYKVMENLIFFPAMLMGLMLPLLSHAHAHDRKAFAMYAAKTLKVFTIITVPIGIGILMRAEDIMRIVGGADFDYNTSAVVLRIITVALIGIFYGQFFTTTLIIGGHQRKLLVAFAIAAAINIFGNLLLIPPLAHNGAAIMSAITEVFVALASMALVISSMHYTPHIPQFMRIALAGACMTGALIVIPAASLPIAIAVSAVVYIAALMVTRAITLDEIRMIFARTA